jgi:hypothetical protein
MCPQPFHWLITIGRSYPGVLNLHRIKISRVGRYAQLIVKITMAGLRIDRFIEIYAIIATDRQLLSKIGTLTWLKWVGVF